MYYLQIKNHEEQCRVGDKCMVLADFFELPAGTKGEIVEIYDGGVMVYWKDLGIRDGFSRDELIYLAFGTKSYA